jgi:hypothetical protein
MKELTNQEKIEIVEEARKRMKREFEGDPPIYRGICLWITLAAYHKNFLASNEVEDDGYRGHLARQLIPELLKIKPKDADIDYLWFGTLRRKNIPVRLQALDRLLEILKSNQHERTVNT